MQNTENNLNANRDPLSGEAGAHPVGVGVGAALGGAAAGAAAGTVVGPLGTIIGAAVGAIAGGLAGKGVAESVDPTVEETYWRDNHATRPYAATPGTGYDDYAPAYKYGTDASMRHPGRKFADVEADLGREWNKVRGKSSLEWERAKVATSDAWNRVSDSVERAIPGDSDRDGK